MDGLIGGVNCLSWIITKVLMIMRVVMRCWNVHRTRGSEEVGEIQKERLFDTEGA